MKKMDIQCLFIGKQSTLYSSLVRSLCKFDLNVRVKLVDAEKDHVLFALKKLRGASLVFISDDIQFSLDVLSDLIWQYAPDAAVVVLTTENKATTVSSNQSIHTKFSRLLFKSNDDKTRLFLQCLIQTVRFKTEFRRCKRLLGISEKRCLWLVESSQEAIAYITKDLHLFANASYLELFNAESSEKLRSISIKELIGSNEYSVFKQFFDSQLKRCDVNRSLILTMKKTNGVEFRANVHLIPSVYKGKKCLQLWVGKVEQLDDLPKINSPEKTDKIKAEKTISKYGLKTSSSQLDIENQAIPNPFEVLNKSPEVERLKVDPSIIIVELIKRKEARLSAQKVIGLNGKKKIEEHHFLSLVVNEEQKTGVNSLLFEPQTATLTKQQTIFWDKVKFSRLFQVLRQKTKLDVFLVVEMSVASVTDKAFTEWFILEIARLGVKSSHLVLSFPSILSDYEKNLAVSFSKKLKSHRCKIAMSNYLISKVSLNILKSVRPDYVSFSAEWIKQLEGNDKREISLGSAIRQFESNDIKVIAPCSFSSHMCKVFALAGASFCLENTSK